MKALIYLPLLAAALLLGWQLRPDPQQPVADTASAPSPATESSASAPASLLHSTADIAAAPAAASLRGTEVDGRLQSNADGSLLISDQLRHLFDYYLSTAGEQSHAQITAQVQALITASLQEPARGQALDLFQRYLDYQQQLVQLEQDFPVAADLDALWARQDAVQRLRAELFSAEEHHAFFAGEELYNRFTLERLSILRNPDLSDADKAYEVEALRERLPDEMQALLVPQIHQDLRQQTRALRDQGASEVQVRELRLSLVGPEATARLEALDQQRSAWQQRLSAFNREREAILNQPGLADSDRASALQALLEERFDSSEQLRISALEARQPAR
ncbi:MAG: lipase secretion chaperone [Pseudomonadaceae bacterium]